MFVDGSTEQGTAILFAGLAKRPTSKGDVLVNFGFGLGSVLALWGNPGAGRVSGAIGKSMLQGALGAPLAHLRDNIEYVAIQIGPSR